MSDYFKEQFDCGDNNPACEATEGQPSSDALLVEEKTAPPQKQQSFDYKYATQIMVTVIVAIVLAVSLRMFVFPSIVVCGPSMDDNLYGGVYDNSKSEYIGGDTVLLFKTTKFKQGDIIVFKTEAYPNSIIINEAIAERNIIKRVIAVGGQTVTLKRVEDIYCEVYIDGQLLLEDYLLERMRYRNILVANETSFTWEVPENCLFVMGDNRNVSGDSRMYGVVSLEDKKNIGGKAILLWNTDKEHKKLTTL